MAQIITETFIVSKSKILKESSGGSDGYRLKLWSKMKNRNGRGYGAVIPFALKNWAHLVTECLTNHPEDEEDMTKVNGTVGWPKLDSDGWMSILWKPAGSLGQTFADHLNNGGSIAISSVIYGNVDDYGEIVIDDELELLRWCDIVADPSNGLFMNKDGEITYVRGDLDYSDIAKKESVNEETDDNKLSIEYMEDKKKMDATKIAEANISLNVKALIKEAAKIASPVEKKAALEEAMTYAEMLSDKSLYGQIAESVKDCDTEVEKLINLGSKYEEDVANLKNENEKRIEESAEALREENEALRKRCESLEDDINTISALYKRVQDDSDNQSEEAEKKDVEVSTLLDTISALEEKFTALKESTAKKIKEEFIPINEYDSAIADKDAIIADLRKQLIAKVADDAEEIITDPLPAEAPVIDVPEVEPTQDVVFDEYTRVDNFDTTIEPEVFTEAFDAYMDNKFDFDNPQGKDLSKGVILESVEDDEDDDILRYLNK